MTRKEYNLIAEKLNIKFRIAGFSITDGNDDELGGFMMAVKGICWALQEDNWRFDEEKFINAVTDTSLCEE